ncbi:leucoanthocyanidin dioxygenase-like [Cryptomeria japonica]|uniref:leucoanthocyanidin dioxygenase-like n=1 Tax=Cryptomeria japonica TaxID=3369 RepID=UPI0027D9D5F9|nr:leucoanthocyanidin dioxygenase-like [Cryptomeria japonica]
MVVPLTSPTASKGVGITYVGCDSIPTTVVVTSSGSLFSTSERSVLGPLDWFVVAAKVEDGWITPPKPQDTQVRVIDLHALGAQDLQQETIAAISNAAQNWGFFQIVNHGIPSSLISRMQAVGKAFFDLPLAEKELYKSELAGSPIGYGSKLGYSPDAKLDWGDYHHNVTLPPHRRNMSKWPT